METKPWYPKVLVAGVATVVTVGYGVVLYAFSVLVTDAAAGAEFSATVLSGAFGGAVLTSGAAAITVGRITDRHGVRGLMAVGSLAAGAGLAGFAAAREPWQVLAVWWLVLGPASAMILYEPAFVVIEQWFSRERRNRAVATLVFVGGLAGPIFIPLTTWLVGQVGWRQATVVLAVLVAVVGTGTALAVIRPAPSVRVRRADPVRAPAVRLRTVLASPRFVLFTLAICLALAAFEALLVHRIARFESAGFALSQVAFWAVIGGVASFPGRYLLPALANRFRATHLLVIVLVGLVAATALAVRGTSQIELIGHFVLFGIFLGAAVPLRTVIMADWYGGAAEPAGGPGFGQLMGMQAAALAVARATGPVGVGALRDLLDGYGVALVVVAVAMAAAAVLTLRSATARDPLVS